MAETKALKTRYKYLHFELDRFEPDDKTKGIYKCYNTKHGDDLGLVSFDRVWKQYVFAPSYCSEFSASCLDDISNFLGQLNK